MSEDAQLTPEQFVMRAIETLRNSAKSKGIHTVFSGFNKPEEAPKEDVPATLCARWVWTGPNRA
jgi:hypothetical protein